MGLDCFLLFKDFLLALESLSTEFSQSSQRWLHNDSSLHYLHEPHPSFHQGTALTSQCEDRIGGSRNHLLLARCFLDEYSVENTWLHDSEINIRKKSKCKFHKHMCTQTYTNLSESKLTVYLNSPFWCLTLHVVWGNRYSNERLMGVFKTG